MIYRFFVRSVSLLPAVTVLAFFFAFAPERAVALEQVGELVMPAGLDELREVVRGPDGRHAYFVTATDPVAIIRFDLETFEFVDSLALEPDEYPVGSGFIDPDGSHAYFGTATSPGRVVKIDLENFERIDALELDEGLDFLRTAFVDHDGKYGYFGTNTEPGRLVRIDLELFEPAGWIEMDPENSERNLNLSVIDPAGEFAYLMTTQRLLIGYVPPERVIKIDLEAFERVDAITLAEGEYWLSAAMIDPAGDFLWVVNSMSTARIARIDLNEFERMDGFVLPGGDGDTQIESGVMDASGEFAYLGTRTDPPRVVKLDLVEFRPLRSIEIGGDPGSLRTAVIDADDRFLHFGTDSAPGTVVRVDTLRPELRLHPQRVEFDQQVVGYLSVPLPVTLSNPGSAPAVGIESEFTGSEFKLVASDCPNVLPAGASCTLELAFRPLEDGDVVRALSVADDAGSWAEIELVGTAISDSGFRPEVSIEIPHPYWLPWAPLIHPSGHSAYFSFTHFHEPGRIVRIDLDSFELDERIVLAEGEFGAFASVMDSVAEYAYYAIDHRVIKIHLDSYTVVDSLELTDGDEQLRAAVIDPHDQYAYFASSAPGTRIFRVDLESFEKDGTLESGLGDVDFSFGEMHSSGQYAYFTYYRLHEVSGIVRVDLQAFALAGDIELSIEARRPNVLLLDSSSEHAFVTGFSIPTEIIRIDLATFEPAGSLQLPESDGGASVGTASPDGRKAYLFTTLDGAPPTSLLVRLDLESFERIDRTVVGSSYTGNLVIDPDGRFAYVCTNDELVKVRLKGPNLRFEPELLDFGVPGGESGEVRLTAELINEGMEELTGLTLGLYEDNFSIAWTDCLAELPGGGSCQVEVAFDSAAHGAEFGAVHVNSDQLAPARLNLVAGVIDPIFGDRFATD